MQCLTARSEDRTVDHGKSATRLCGASARDGEDLHRPAEMQLAIVEVGAAAVRFAQRMRARSRAHQRTPRIQACPQHSAGAVLMGALNALNKDIEREILRTTELSSKMCQCTRSAQILFSYLSKLLPLLF
mmetsp:Transcript_10868/g.35733  ORF Transcript_10868/g.35733 Transcript_10868/m.35733 type:complete len:130 (+) Transcript_10868:382-771(+)